MSSFYFLIPTNELTKDQLRVSTSFSTSELVTKTIDMVPYYVVEVEEGMLRNNSDYFFGYQKLLKNQISSASPIREAEKIAFQGLISDTVSSTSTATYSFSSNKIIDKIQFYSKNVNDGDYITINITDSNDNVLLTPVSNWYMFNGVQNVKIKKSLILSGTKIKITYTKTGSLTPFYFMNAYLRDA